MSNERPSTSKARGVCKYYLTPRGCFAGPRCKFLHGQEEKLTPYDKSKTCRYYDAGYCKRGDKCWFRHVQPTPAAASSSSAQDAVVTQEQQNDDDDDDDDDDDLMCSICYEIPVTFGLLDGCSHVFCIACIRGWRDPKDKDDDLVYSGNTKKCPTCRAASKFVTPSSVFYTASEPGKAEVTAQYKATMASIPCRYFQRSLSSNRFCPFGKDCFYQHLNGDGTPYEFKHGVEYYMRRKGRYERQILGSLLQEHSRPFFEHVHAALDSIRATLEGSDFAREPTNDESVADAANQDWRELGMSASLLAGLGEGSTYSLIEDVGLDAYAEEMFSIWSGILPRLEAVTGEILDRSGSGTRDATVNPPSFAPPPSDETEEDSVPEATSVTDEDSDDDSSVQSEGSGVVGEATPDIPIDEAPERREEVEPPFLTDGRGRVVWSNTKPNATNGSSA